MADGYAQIIMFSNIWNIYWEREKPQNGGVIWANFKIKQNLKFYWGETGLKMAERFEQIKISLAKSEILLGKGQKFQIGGGIWTNFKIKQYKNFYWQWKMFKNGARGVYMDSDKF